jgi:hypothetical protein
VAFSSRKQLSASSLQAIGVSAIQTAELKIRNVTNIRMLTNIAKTEQKEKATRGPP